MLIAASTREAVECVKRKLLDNFEARDMGEAGLFLGMCIVRDRKRRLLWLHQGRYAREVVARFGMTEARAISAPMARERAHRLGHLSYKAMVDMVKNGAVEGLNASEKELRALAGQKCDICLKTKQVASSHFKSESRAGTALKLIHSNLMVLMETMSAQTLSPDCCERHEWHGSAASQAQVECHGGAQLRSARSGRSRPSAR
jgi:hypothetical protein